MDVTGNHSAGFPGVTADRTSRPCTRRVLADRSSPAPEGARQARLTGIKAPADGAFVRTTPSQGRCSFVLHPASAT